MSWGAKARQLNADPNKFENTILDLERKRFGVKQYDPYDKEIKAAADYYQGKHRAEREDLGAFKINTDLLNPKNAERSRSRSDKKSDRSVGRYPTDLSYSSRKYDQISQSTPDLSRFGGSRKTFDDRERDYQRISERKSKIKPQREIIDDHRAFRNTTYDTENAGLRKHSPKMFTTPNKSQQLKFYNDLTSKSKGHPNRSVIINEEFNDIQNYDPDSRIPATHDGMNSYVRKFLYKELDKIRNDARKSNSLLSKNISDNEEFYTK